MADVGARMVHDGRMSGKSRQTARQSRQRTIVDHVVSNGFASAADLAGLTAVSLMTVHRDIDELVGRGVLRKYHGGVSAQPSTVFESSSDFRMHAAVREKEALARAALRFVHPGMSVILDDSTTVLALARLLVDIGPLTVATNYLRAIEVFREAEDVRLLGLGGEYSRTHDSFIGLSCQEAIGRLSLDVMFQSTSAMTESMTFHQEQEIVLVKRALMASASLKVLLMDGSKVGRTALHRFTPVADFDHVLIAGEVDEAILDALGERTDVIRVPVT